VARVLELRRRKRKKTSLCRACPIQHLWKKPPGLQFQPKKTRKTVILRQTNRAPKVSSWIWDHPGFPLLRSQLPTKDTVQTLDIMFGISFPPTSITMRNHWGLVSHQQHTVDLESTKSTPESGDPMQFIGFGGARKSMSMGRPGSPSVLHTQRGSRTHILFFAFYLKLSSVFTATSLVSI
jgi:hypothetical protein